VLEEAHSSQKASNRRAQGDIRVSDRYYYPGYAHGMPGWRSTLSEMRMEREVLGSFVCSHLASSDANDCQAGKAAGRQAGLIDHARSGFKTNPDGMAHVTTDVW